MWCSTSEPLDNLAIGLVMHPGTELLTGNLDVSGGTWSYLASFGQQTLFDDNLGMVLMFQKKDLVEQTRDENSYVLIAGELVAKREIATVGFYPDGTCSPYTVSMKIAGFETNFQMDPWTGVQLVDPNEDEAGI